MAFIYLIKGGDDPELRNRGMDIHRRKTNQQSQSNGHKINCSSAKNHSERPLAFFLLTKISPYQLGWA